MAKQRKQKSSAKSSSSDEKIPENEQWRIIEESGVLKKVPDEWRSNATSNPSPPTPAKQEETNGDDDDDPFSPLCNELFGAFCFTIPFSSLYIMMDVLAHRQYSQQITTRGLFDKIIWGIPFIFAFIFYSQRYRGDRRAQGLMLAASIFCGCRLIYIVNWASYRTVIDQCASLGTIWVYSIVYLDLLPAVAALAIVGSYVKWKDLKIIF